MILDWLKSEDNTATVVNKGKSSVGEYKFTDGNRIKLSLSGVSSLAGSQIFTILIFGDVLNLIDLNGKTSKYLRFELTD